MYIRQTVKRTTQVMNHKPAEFALSKQHKKRLNEYFVARPDLCTTTLSHESVCADINAWFKQNNLQPVYTVKKLKKRISMCEYRKRQVAAVDEQKHKVKKPIKRQVAASNQHKLKKPIKRQVAASNQQPDWMSAAQQMTVFFPISQLPVPLVIVGSWSLQNFELLRAGFGAAVSSVIAVCARCETGSDWRDLQRQGVRGLDAPCLDDVCVTDVNHPVFQHETAVAMCAYEGPNIHTGFVFIEQLFCLFHRMSRGSVLLLFLRGAVVTSEWVKNCASRFELHVACIQQHTRCGPENAQAIIITQQRSSEEELPVLQTDEESLAMLPQMETTTWCDLFQSTVDDLEPQLAEDVTMQDHIDVDELSINSAKI